MKILMVNKFLYPNGGSETYIFRLGEYFASAGHEVEYFGMQDERNVVTNTAGQYTSNLDFHSSSLQKLVYPFKIIYSKESRKKLADVIQSFKPDVIHLNNINFQLTPSIIYEAKKWKVPTVMTAHDYQMVCPNHMMYRPVEGKPCQRCVGGHYSNCIKNKCIHGSTAKSLLGVLEATFYKSRKTYALLDAVICPSYFLEKRLLVEPVFKNKTEVLHNFVDTPDLEPEPKQEYVLYFGRYSKEKGIETLLEASRRLPQVNFVFAGKGPMGDMIPEQDNVKNVGFIQGKELNQLVANALFTVYPSEWYENCPFSVMESQACGTPVLGSGIGGIPELIEDGETGLLFMPGDIKDLSAKIFRLWQDRDLLDYMTENCRQIEFDTVQKYADKLLLIYAKAGAGGNEDGKA